MIEERIFIEGSFTGYLYSVSKGYIKSPIKVNYNIFNYTCVCKELERQKQNHEQKHISTELFNYEIGYNKYEIIVTFSHKSNKDVKCYKNDIISSLKELTYDMNNYKLIIRDIKLDNLGI